MRQFLTLVILCFASFITEIKAQHFTKSYLDSVKEFFNAFAATHPKFEESIIEDYSSDTASHNPYNSLLHWIRFFPEKSICTIKNIKYDTVWHDNKYSVVKPESDGMITISPGEVKLLLQKTIESKTFKIPQDFFPESAIVKSFELDDFYKKCSQEHCKFQSRTFSLPAFIRNGKFAVCYSIYSCGKDCGYLELVVYKNEKGHWKRFGDHTLMVF